MDDPETDEKPDGTRPEPGSNEYEPDDTAPQGPTPEGAPVPGVKPDATGA